MHKLNTFQNILKIIKLHSQFDIQGKILLYYVYDGHGEMHLTKVQPSWNSFTCYDLICRVPRGLHPFP